MLFAGYLKSVLSLKNLIEFSIFKKSGFHLGSIGREAQVGFLSIHNKFTQPINLNQKQKLKQNLLKTFLNYP